MTRVIKIGGRPQSAASLPASVAMASRMKGGVVIVHGGGDEVSMLQSALGGSTKFVNGRRVTMEKDIDIVRMALSGSANKRLVAALVDIGVNAVGLSGEDASLISATPMDPEQLGFVGAPSKVNTHFMKLLLDNGYLPVISPISRDESGTMGSALNVNGDDAAASVAVALGASELLLVADVEGVMSDGMLVQSLTPAQAQQLIDNGTAAGGMQAKLQAGIAALQGGVARVRISDIHAIEDLSRGTTLRLTGDHS
ncbi:MAG TPA: acetylglutamate kinase [Gemmatimonadaceae bacterium]